MLVSFVFLAVTAPSAGYARPELLVEAAARAADPAALVLDVRPREKYLAGHVPGAVWVDAADWGKAFGPGAAAEAWNERLGKAGIDPDTRVVVYADDVRDAARIWWILRYWGVKDVRLLNGGWRAWQAGEGKVVTQETVPQRKTVRLTALEERLATKQQLLDLLKGMPPQIVDARSSAEFCGEAETARRNGSVPGAVHLEWTECLDPKTGRFKSADELRRLLAERGIDVNKPAVTYCQSGGRASVMAFTLELMGGKQVRNYYRSWSEWGNDPDTPVVKPKPGK
jgi:thiosulfate/3-mercaptopyruvate sulfurtransferase